MAAGELLANCDTAAMAHGGDGGRRGD